MVHFLETGGLLRATDKTDRSFLLGLEKDPVTAIFLPLPDKNDVAVTVSLMTHSKNILCRLMHQHRTVLLAAASWSGLQRRSSSVVSSR